MLTVLSAHISPIAPAGLWGAWNWDPAIWTALAAATVLHRNARRPGLAHHRPSQRRRRLFWLGLLSLVIAMLSPLDALSSALASAHMAQHLLLVLIAPPLLVLGGGSGALIMGLPATWSRRLVSLRRTSWARVVSRFTRRPVLLSAVHVGVVWFWHAGGPYDAALKSELVHAVEHTAFFVTALLSWNAIVRTRRLSGAASGTGVLVLFGLSVQSAVLGALLTFAPTAWYDGYSTTTAAWGLTRLADQQLAGVIMWVPAGGVYLVAALYMLIAWITASEPARYRIRQTPPTAAKAQSG